MCGAPAGHTCEPAGPGVLTQLEQRRLLTVTTAGGVQVNGAKVLKTDIVADNGVIHVIDTVVIPK